MYLEDLDKKLDVLLGLVSQKAYGRIRDLLELEEPIDIAEICEDLSEEDLSLVFRLLPKDLASDVFVHLSSEKQGLLIKAYSDEELTSVLSGLYNDDLVEMLEELPASVAQRVLRHTSPDRRREVNRLLQYEDYTAGSIMTTEYMRLEAKMTVAEALHKLKNISTRIEMIYDCFVTTDTRIMQGIISVADLLRAKDEELVEDLMDDKPHFVFTYEAQEEAASIMQRYDLLSLPVLDREERLVGIITVDDAMEVIMDEATDHHSHMAAVQPGDLPYPETSVFNNIKRRLFWLMLLMLSGSLNAVVLGYVEAVYLAVPMLVAFMPMLTSTGGNAASQTSSVEIVALSTGEVSFKDIFKVVTKELGIGLVCASVLASLNGIVIYFSQGRNLKLTLTILISFFAVVLASKLIASILPFLAKALRLDPAMVVSPIVTTLVDIFALLVYYGLAAWIFGISI